MRRTRSRPAGTTIARPVAIMGGLGVLVVASTACFTTAADFREDAENFIEQDEGLRSAAFFETSASFVEATCAEPASQDEGSTFPCTATDSNGDVWEFDIVITGSTEYEVVVSRRPTEP